MDGTDLDRAYAVLRYADARRRSAALDVHDYYGQHHERYSVYESRYPHLHRGMTDRQIARLAIVVSYLIGSALAVYFSTLPLLITLVMTTPGAFFLIGWLVEKKSQRARFCGYCGHLVQSHGYGSGLCHVEGCICTSRRFIGNPRGQIWRA